MSSKWTSALSSSLPSRTSGSMRWTCGSAAWASPLVIGENEQNTSNNATNRRRIIDIRQMRSSMTLFLAIQVRLANKA
ncbi:Uncharacterised protein [Bordetella pertussis]|nr:Uncharacterised protein [Bordetella pertussis]CFP66858.1 Uncharacterised protein [Bordetella pertussis]CFW37479.1 Uncharacterised protein [Bordetella pertussis]